MASTVETGVRTQAARSWWLWLVTGAIWIVFSVIILQFDAASAATVGIIFGAMLLGAALEYAYLGSVVRDMRWLWYLYGAILAVGGLVALVYPTRTFLAVANIFGFMFVIIGIMWSIEAFMVRDYNDLWWFSLISGILMMGFGFWLGGQFLITQAVALLTFAGIWALMKGILDITTAFTVKSVGA